MHLLVDLWSEVVVVLRMVAYHHHYRAHKPEYAGALWNLVAKDLWLDVPRVKEAIHRNLGFEPCANHSGVQTTNLVPIAEVLYQMGWHRNPLVLVEVVKVVGNIRCWRSGYFGIDKIFRLIWMETMTPMRFDLLSRLEGVWFEGFSQWWRRYIGTLNCGRGICRTTVQVDIKYRRKVQWNLLTGLGLFRCLAFSLQPSSLATRFGDLCLQFL